ncbi:sugar ABC transporter permease [Paenibacillus cisolokensis]|jgi:ABC-type sugar transport systems, permease components|uniref:ABC transporter permease n=1 Tax=Paenibacillus cisolokensis TaxID=1658519 RepID=A0ABQ4N833_9BACL|nr:MULTISPECIES: sugar ABC transporter permease [Paenibacillus]ALS29031.1 ABC transporter permease [Paenibacillus sp. 32O-W]GIQ64331.1 ABC transporter permease [Paenibacillus cisolokensis]
MPVLERRTKGADAVRLLPVRLRTVWKEVVRNRSIYLMLAPYFLIFFTFTVLPVVLSLLVSFTNFNMLQWPEGVGWSNYARLFVRDDVFLIALKNTLLFAAITGPISYIACFVLAWIINELSPKIRAIATLVFYAPALSGNAFIVWTLLFSSDSYGYINAFLIKWRIILEPILWLKDPKYIMTIIIIVQLWLSLGTSFLAFIAGLQTMDKTLFEAGAIDGIRNRWQELWYITLPSMRPMLLFGAVIQITSSFAVAEVATQLAGFPSVQYAGHTIVTHLMDYGSIRYEMGYASAIATVLFALMLGSNLIVRRLLSKVGD